MLNPRHSMRARVAAWVVFVACSAALAADVRAQTEPAGPQVDLSELAPDPFLKTSKPAAAGLPGGGFVVAWAESSSSGSRLVARIFDDSGLATGNAFRVDSSAELADSTSVVRVGSDAAGNFVVAWLGAKTATDSIGFFRRFDAAGTPLATTMRVADSTTLNQADLRLSVDPSGAFVATWRATAGGASLGIMARRFDVVGSPLGPEFEVDTNTTPASRSATRDPDVAPDGSGGFLVVWLDTNRGIMARSYDSSGVARGSDYLVSTDPSVSDLSDPRVAAAAGGGFLVTWLKRIVVANAVVGNGLVGRLLDSIGSPLGAEAPVTHSIGGQAIDNIASLSREILGRGDGTFLSIVRTSTSTSGQTTRPVQGILAQRVSGAGLPLGDAFPVNALRPAGDAVAAANLVNDRLLIVWRVATPGVPGSTLQTTGVYGQRYCQPTDTTCDRCPGFDDTLDGDADGIADGCDLCLNVAGQQTIDGKSKLFVTQGRRSKISKLRIKGEVTLPVSFATLRPDLDGMRILGQSALGGGVIFDASIPGPAATTIEGGFAHGWKASANGKKWIYRDKRDVSQRQFGVSKILLVDRGKAEPNRVRVRVVASRGDYPLRPWDPAPKVTIVFGDDTAGQTGVCGETAFIADDCRLGSRTFAALGEFPTVALDLRCR